MMKHDREAFPYEYLVVRLSRVHSAVDHGTDAISLTAALEELDWLESALDEDAEPLPVPYKLLIAELANEISITIKDRVEKQAQRIRDKAEGWNLPDDCF